MHRSLFLLLPLAVLAQLPGFPHGGGACATEWDCSLGGTCSQSKQCVCDPWWTGPACDYLNLQPAESLTSQGLQVPNYFSWGGHPLQSEDGTYHLFASFMCNHASLGSWTSKSSVAHATSTRAEGPFTFSPGLDSQLVVPPWSHGAYIVQDPPTKQFLLWHLGNGAISNASWYPCYNSSQSGVEGSGELVPRSVPGEDTYHLAPPYPGQKQAFVQVSDSLLGPWTPFNGNTGVTVSFPPQSWTNSIDNPAPFIFENGTTLLFFRSETCPKNWGALAPACLGVARADTWQGPYTSLFTEPITHPEGEDPAVFMDPRGNLHMLTNVNTYHARCAQGVPCGGHAWSYDGLTWSNQSIGAFGPVIRFTNGTYFQGAYAERPQVLQAEDRTPIAFYVSHVPDPIYCSTSAHLTHAHYMHARPTLQSTLTQKKMHYRWALAGEATWTVPTGRSSFARRRRTLPATAAPSSPPHPPLPIPSRAGSALWSMPLLASPARGDGVTHAP